VTRQLTAKLLLVMNDSTQYLPLEADLDMSGFDVSWATSCYEALRRINLDKPSFIILDILLQGIGGTRLCKIIRANPEMTESRIIMIGDSVDQKEKMTALDAGADDYLVKPITAKELLAKISGMQRHHPDAPTFRVLQAGTIKMVPEEWVVYVSGNPVDLTEKEYRLLHELLQVKGRVLSRESLLERVWGHQKVINLETRTVDVHMSRLRNKLGSSASSIITVRNVGYRINVSSEWLKS